MRKRLLAPAAAVLLTATLGSAAAAPEPPECVVAARWVQVHRGSLPTTLGEFSRYSILYRRAIYDVLPPATREAMWREHLEGFLRSGQPFNEPQRAAIREAIAQLPAYIGAKPEKASAEALRVHWRTVFDPPTIKRVFGTLGPVPPRDAAKARQPECNCESDWDCGESTCRFTRCSFTTGCGPFWDHLCTGFCHA